MNKVIFLDIDGPMIPGSMYLQDSMVSFERVFSPVCTLVIERLATHSGAKIVFNTTHNRQIEDLKKAWYSQCDRTLLHEQVCTSYPSKSRYHAIREWLDKYKDKYEVSKWVALDDEFIGPEKDGYILVDFDSGLTLSHYNKAMRHFGLKPFLVL